MARQIITDEESKLKRQARRRLIGAITLTILAAALIPMLLDSKPPAPPQEIELQIPDKDKAGEFVPKMVLPHLNATGAASQPASVPVIAPLLDVKPASSVLPAKVESKPAIETKPLVDLKPKAENEKATSKPEAKPAAEAKPIAKPVAKPASKFAPNGHSGFVVQVGAFVKAETAKKLQEKLHKQGYPSYTEIAGDKTRVRMGDYSTHAEADKVRLKLESQGLQANVVNLK